MKIKTLRNKADRLLQEWGRDNYKRCEMCNAMMSCLHHFHPKSSSSALRYEKNNMIPVCHPCHLGFHSSRSADFNSRIIIKRGNEWAKKLLKKKAKIIKPNQSYYLKIIKKYEM